MSDSLIMQGHTPLASLLSHYKYKLAIKLDLENCFYSQNSDARMDPEGCMCPLNHHCASLHNDRRDTLIEQSATQRVHEAVYLNNKHCVLVIYLVQDSY